MNHPAKWRGAEAFRYVITLKKPGQRLSAIGEYVLDVFKRMCR